MRHELLLNGNVKFVCLDMEALEAVIDSAFYADNLESWKITWDTIAGPASVGFDGELCLVDFYNLKRKVKRNKPIASMCKTEIMALCKG